MAIGFPGSPFNKKQFSVDSKLYEYNSTLGAWSKSVRAPVSPGTATITDISNLVDGSNLLNNPGSTIPSYATEVEILSQSVGVQDGQMAYAEDTDKLYVFSGYSWYKTSTAIEYVPPPPGSWYGTRGIYAGDTTTIPNPGIEYLDISTLGSSATFGSFSDQVYATAALTNGNRAVFAGGDNNIVDIKYVQFATPGNAQAFGNMVTTSTQGPGDCGMCDGTYGVYSIGRQSSSDTEYVTIDTTANAQTFGALVNNGRRRGGTSDGTTGVIGGGQDNIVQDGMAHIDYITIATPGNGSDFGDLNQVGMNVCAVGDGTYAIFAGGLFASQPYGFFNRLEYVTVATPGNASNFGTLSTGRSDAAGTHDATTGVIIGGTTSSWTSLNSIESFTMATLGNASAFSTTVSATVSYASGCSGSAS